MNILITGAFGFVGTNLSKSLKAAFSPHLTAVDIQKPDCKIVYDDFFFWKEIQHINWNKIDAIIHLAGLAHDTRNHTNEKTYFDTNVGLTRQIFHYFLRSGATKFIFMSSVKASADGAQKKPLMEADTPHPQTVYGKSKFAAEQFIQEQALPTEKKYYILRSCMIHGPGNKGNLNSLYRMVRRGIPWPLGSFNNQRSFTSIDNLIFVISNLLTKDIETDIYQVADDETVSTNRIIEMIAATAGKKPHILKINKKMVYFFAKTGDIFHLPLTSARLQKLTESYRVSNEKIKSAIGIKHMPVRAEEGLKKTFYAFSEYYS